MFREKGKTTGKLQLDFQGRNSNSGVLILKGGGENAGFLILFD